MAKGALKNVKKALKGFFRHPEEASLEVLLRDYRSLEDEEKAQFFEELSRYGLSYEEWQEKVRSFLEPVPQGDWRERLRHLRGELVTPRERFFKSFASVKGGLKFLLDLRADLRRLGRRMKGFDWHEIDQDIVFLLDMWFVEGFLYLSEIGLDTPYRQISFLKEHDMVHPMTTVEDMARRLGKDRLCYALYHVLMPEEPIVFIEVALTEGIVGSIKEIMEPPPERQRPNTAIFYSINNTQQGLAGLGLGKVLIGKVVEEIRRKYPNIKNFATLSPIPGLWRRYFEPLLRGEGGFRMTRERFLRLFPEESREAILSRYRSRGGKREDFAEALHELLSSPDWIKEPVYIKHLAEPLRKAVYFYLTEEKDPRGRPLDPVANFHLENGATVSPEHVRFLGNPYDYGVRNSLSFMVNYIYHLHWLEQIKETLPSLWGKIKGVFPS